MSNPFHSLTSSGKKKYVRRTNMRRLQRKTRVLEEKWVRIEDWYWCPISVVEERIRKESPDPIPVAPLGSSFMLNQSALTPEYRKYLKYDRWCKTQRAPYSRIAHVCSDGKISAIWLEHYQTKRGPVLSGICPRKCCEKKLTPGIRAIITMELDL